MSPFGRGVAPSGRGLDVQIEQLEGGFFGGEVAFGFEAFSEVAVEGFDGVGRVDGASDLLRECEEGRDLFPSSAPGLRDHRVASTVLVLEVAEGALSVFPRGGGVDLAQFGAHGFSFFPWNKARAASFSPVDWTPTAM